MIQSELETLVRDVAKHHGADADLCCALAQVESHWRADAVRFEPSYRWLYEPTEFSVRLKISLESERALQRFSYGPMQVMGAVCRELGYKGTLAVLASHPELSVLYAVKKLVQLSKRYESELDLISAYNAGSPKRSAAGEYRNQRYVDGASKVLQKIRAGA